MIRSVLVSSGYVVAQFARGVCSFSFRVFEYKREIKTDLPASRGMYPRIRHPPSHSANPTMISVEIATPGILLTDRVHESPEFLICVCALHELEDAVVARLQRQVDVAAHLGVIRDDIEKRFGEIFGMRRCKTNPFDPRHIGHGRAPDRRIPWSRVCMNSRSDREA